MFKRISQNPYNHPKKDTIIIPTLHMEESEVHVPQPVSGKHAGSEGGLHQNSSTMGSDAVKEEKGKQRHRETREGISHLKIIYFIISF